MKNKLTLLTLAFLATFLFASCNRVGKPSPETGSQEAPKGEGEPQQVVDMRCFAAETPYSDGSGLKDREELTVVIEGDKVSGSYNWLPAEKDAMEGAISGTIKGQVANVQYVYMQEGVADTMMLEISFAGDSAMIKSGDVAGALQGVNCGD